MLKFLGKVVVGAVAVYVLNEYFKETKIVERVVQVAAPVMEKVTATVVQVADGLLTEFARAQEAAKMQQGVPQ